ncbi:peptidoglycan-binding protein [Microvirga sp. TS319]|uniref:peptidoglycan-binding protein n=1 Tax=Microvirga sp. TS319 TaxID=3241165 RepID=UPI00351A4B33
MQTAALQDYQAQYSAQRQKTEESVKELANLRQELSNAQSQIQTLTTQSEQAAADMAKAREQLAAAQQGGAFPGVGMSPEILSIKPRPTKEDVVAAQQALSQLRFGTIKADGAMGPSTREAIEKFQRAAGLPVTGELHAQTLVTLMRSAKVMAAAQSDVP